MITPRPDYDDRYPHCETTFAELRLYSDIVPPEDMERELGLKPTEFQKKGQKVLRDNGSERQISVSAFFLSSRGHVTSLDLRRHLDWLLGMLVGKKLALGALLDRGQIEAAIDCVWWLNGTNGGPIIRADQLAAIADLQLELSVDFGELPRELAP